VEKVKACPFCGSKKVEFLRSLNFAMDQTNSNACWIICLRCEGQVSSSPDRTTAIRSWNKRFIDRLGYNVTEFAEIVYDDDK
jgi:Lar family restriction alleviation protein